MSSSSSLSSRLSHQRSSSFLSDVQVGLHRFPSIQCPSLKFLGKRRSTPTHSVADKLADRIKQVVTATMAARAPTCLSCLRRITATPASSSLPGFSFLVSGSQQQLRYKSKKCYDQGVIVRLLEDVPKYGRKGQFARLVIVLLPWPSTNLPEQQTQSSASNAAACATSGIPPRKPNT